MKKKELAWLLGAGLACGAAFAAAMPVDEAAASPAAAVAAFPLRVPGLELLAR